MDDYTESRYGMILDRYINMVLEIDNRFYKYTVVDGVGWCKGCTTSIIYLYAYEPNISNRKNELKPV